MIMVVVIAANLASGGMGEVALPSLAHAKFGAAGYGALLACLAAGGVIGWLSRRARSVRPATSQPCCANEPARVRCMARISVLRIEISAGGCAFRLSPDVSQAASDSPTRRHKTQRENFMRLSRRTSISRLSANWLAIPGTRG